MAYTVLLLAAGLFCIITPLFYVVVIRFQGPIRHEWLSWRSRPEICSKTPSTTYVPSSAWFDQWFANYSEYAAGVDRWTSYFRPYDHHFAQYRGQTVTLLEIGVQSGGSINMWRDYFGSGLIYYGLDINKKCKRFSRENVTIFIGDQGDLGTMRNLSQTWPTFDIIIDDGGHSMQQQTASFEVLFRKLRVGGVYLIEDLHTSYWNENGGSSNGETMTTIEHSKSWIDVLNLQHHRNRTFRSNQKSVELHSTMDSLHFYDSMVFITKDNVKSNVNLRKGGRWIYK